MNRQDRVNYPLLGQTSPSRQTGGRGKKPSGIRIANQPAARQSMPGTFPPHDQPHHGIPSYGGGNPYTSHQPPGTTYDPAPTGGPYISDQPPGTTYGPSPSYTSPGHQRGPSGAHPPLPISNPYAQPVDVPERLESLRLSADDSTDESFAKLLHTLTHPNSLADILPPALSTLQLNHVHTSQELHTQLATFLSNDNNGIRASSTQRLELLTSAVVHCIERLNTTDQCLERVAEAVRIVGQSMGARLARIEDEWGLPGSEEGGQQQQEQEQQQQKRGFLDRIWHREV
ncbi:hypothetical protein BU26DRAFT_520845 [Trematosphaeria pertusa]|uniref:Uncharacterized protein n=1 Tax=Trematosphaeria pertusa TaxID=390896 RepID=A0A6A6IDZ8_9PLEO|nr:uncharacterized protein BU26DRAFT_520845 [Trematosphaeria pertusa]KAF2247790.1 hypothetical protein BU26DRAFT_520845 [Trematosphaeria pertusa]